MPPLLWADDMGRIIFGAFVMVVWVIASVIKQMDNKPKGGRPKPAIPPRDPEVELQKFLGEIAPKPAKANPPPIPRAGQAAAPFRPPAGQPRPQGQIPRQSRSPAQGVAAGSARSPREQARSRKNRQDAHQQLVVGTVVTTPASPVSAHHLQSALQQTAAAVPSALQQTSLGSRRPHLEDPQARALIGGRDALMMGLLTNGELLTRAMVLGEVLSKPLALRPPR